MGFALPDSHIHAPNERLHLPTFYNGINTAIHFLANLAEDRARGFRPWHGREHPASQETVAAARRRRRPPGDAPPESP
jgi:hypothetical protein